VFWPKYACDARIFGQTLRFSLIPYYKESHYSQGTWSTILQAQHLFTDPSVLIVLGSNFSNQLIRSSIVLYHHAHDYAT